MVGQKIAARFGADFVEGDMLHPRENVEKMGRGEPLTDDDRWPWLEKIGAVLAEATEAGRSTIVACSALKRVYRERLRQRAGGPLIFIYLHGDPDLLAERMEHRTGHFMPPSLLASQLATLEVPTGEPGVVTVSIEGPPEAVAARGIAALEEELR